jgi:biotin transport system substrate-specific component
VVVRTFDTWRQYSFIYFKWRCERTPLVMLLLSFGMAAVTGLAAQVRIPLAHTPVPVTGQVFAVLISGILLGGRYAGFSQILYVGLGAAGVPWFTAGGLLPHTVGYLIGFVPAAFLVGVLSDRYVRARLLLPQAGVMLGGVLVIYLCGALWFAVLMHTGLAETLALAVVPFIGFDLLKAFAAAGLASSVLPRRTYRD